MFYELYRDADVLNGGLWFDPDTMEFIQVTDMDSAAGEAGVTLIEQGAGYVDEKRVEEGARSAGFFDELRPPKPPPKSRKSWDPRSRSWTPPASPGHLFWMPPPLEGPLVVAAWKRWDELEREGVKFKDLPEDLRRDVLTAAEHAFRYGGFDGPPERSAVVIEKGSQGMIERRKWGNATVSKNPTRAVWKILLDMGVFEG